MSRAINPREAPASGPVVVLVGAGWLGLPLGRALVADGYRVRATTTTAARLPALAAANLEPHLLTLEPDSAATWGDVLAGAAAVVVSLPPGVRGAPDAVGAAARYAARLVRLGQLATAVGVRRIVLLSSTAVYPDLPGAPRLTERAADPAHPLVRAEAALAATLPPAVRLVVARLGGLMGPGRAPGRFFQPGQPVPQPAAPVNMLHLTDAITAIQVLLTHPKATGAYTVCASRHPRRAIFYAAAAAAAGISPAQPMASPSVPTPVTGKRLNSARLRRLTGRQFQFDDPLTALAAC